MSTTDHDLANFAQRYAAVWNESDDNARRKAVRELWTVDGVEYIDDTEYRGHDAIGQRVSSAYQEFVGTGEHLFQLGTGNPVAHHGAVSFMVQMMPVTGGTPVWSGLIFVLLDEHCRIRADYQFVGDDAQTRAVTSQFLARLADSDPEEIASIFAESVDWVLDWPTTELERLPWIRGRKTRADVADHFRTLEEHHESPEPQAISPTVLVDGEDAVVFGEIRRTARPTGRPYAARFALRLTVRDGLVVRYHVYEDSLAVARAFGTRQASLA